MIILALDPGTRATGWAVLTPGEHLTAHGTLRPPRALRGSDRQGWLLAQLQALVRAWQPTVLVYEEFTWFAGGRAVVGRAEMERLIGGIQSLAPPCPRLLGLLPAFWGHQLTGQPRHSKAHVAWCVNARLGTTFRGDHGDNHAADAVGLALVASDLLRLEEHSVCR